MTVEAKICGLSTPETIDAAVAAGARWVGFVTYPRSPRHVASNDVLKALGARVPKGVVRIGLFVDPDDALLDERLATGAIDLLQLQGAETPERVAAIKARTGKPVMKVIKVGEAGDVERGIAAYAARRRPADVRGRRRASCPAAMRRPSTGRSSPAAACRCRGSWPAASRPTTSPRRCASPAHAPSTFPLASNRAGV